MTLTHFFCLFLMEMQQRRRSSPTMDTQVVNIFFPIPSIDFEKKFFISCSTIYPPFISSKILIKKSFRPKGHGNNLQYSLQYLSSFAFCIQSTSLFSNLTFFVYYLVKIKLLFCFFPFPQISDCLALCSNNSVLDLLSAAILRS